MRPEEATQRVAGTRRLAHSDSPWFRADPWTLEAGLTQTVRMARLSVCRLTLDRNMDFDTVRGRFSPGSSHSQPELTKSAVLGGQGSARAAQRRISKDELVISAHDGL